MSHRISHPPSDILFQLCIPCASVGTFCRRGESGTFCRLGQFVARKMPMRQLLFMIASVGHLSPGRKWDILSSGTICRATNAGGTFCR